MRTRRLSVVSLLSVLLLAMPAHAKAVKGIEVAAPRVVAEATHIDLEVAELAKDGTRRATVLTLSLPDRSAHGGAPAAELRTQVAGERGEVAEYTAKVMREPTPAGTRYSIELRRAGGEPSKSFDMRVEVARVLRPATPAQIARVARVDGSSMLVTATVR